MRLVFRITGTWLLGMALILLVIDGTRSLAASTFVFTSAGETWLSLHPASLEVVRDFIASRFFGVVLDPILSIVLALPGFAVLAIPGVLFALMGRSRRSRIFLRQDQV